MSYIVRIRCIRTIVLPLYYFIGGVLVASHIAAVIGCARFKAAFFVSPIGKETPHHRGVHAY